MKSIDEQINGLFDSVVRLEVYKEYYNDEGEFVSGNELGSGSYINLRIPEERLPADSESNLIPCILTNRHVIEHAKNVKLRTKIESDVHQFDSEYPELELSDVDDRFIIFHDELDLAVLLMGYYLKKSEMNNIRMAHKYVDEALLFNNEKKINLFSRVAIMGYPLGMFNVSNYHPIVYQGTFAYPPSYNFGGAPEYLLNCDSVNGNSGSIVYGITDSMDFTPIGVQYSIYKHPEHNLTLSKAIKISEVNNIKNKILESYYPKIK